MNWRLTMNWRSELEAIVEAVPGDQLCHLIGELARLDAVARQRLGAENGVPSAPNLDRLLTVEEVAHRLTASTRWVRRHRERLGGRKLDGLLRFSQKAVQRYIDAAPARSPSVRPR